MGLGTRAFHPLSLQCWTDSGCRIKSRFGGFVQMFFVCLFICLFVFFGLEEELAEDQNLVVFYGLLIFNTGERSQQKNDFLWFTLSALQNPPNSIHITVQPMSGNASFVLLTNLSFGFKQPFIQRRLLPTSGKTKETVR